MPEYFVPERAGQEQLHIMGYNNRAVPVSYLIIKLKNN